MPSAKKNKTAKKPAASAARPFKSGDQVFVRGKGRALFVFTAYGPGDGLASVAPYVKVTVVTQSVPVSDLAAEPFLGASEEKMLSTMSDRALDEAILLTQRENEARIASMKEEKELRDQRAKQSQEQAAENLREHIAANIQLFLPLVPRHYGKCSDEHFYDNKEECRRCALLYLAENAWDSEVEVRLAILVNDRETY